MPYWIYLLISGILTNNFVLSRILGICPFLGVSKKSETALGMGLAVIFVMGLTSIITFGINTLLVLADIVYMQSIVFILVIAAVIQLIEIVLKRFLPSLYSSLGVYLPLITTNCTVLGVVIMNVTELTTQNIFTAFINGVSSGIGFALALLLMAGIREKLEHSDIPERFKGFPITLTTASIMAMAFTAFAGLNI